MNKKDIKKALLTACQQQIEERIITINDRLKSIEESRNDETKSSVGDKYETGRAMMQMEEEKAQRQLSEALLVKNTLTKINTVKKSEQIGPGSLVETNKGYYFLAIGIGKLTLANQLYYCVSAQSPIGSILLNKNEKEEFLFNGMKMIIKAVH